MKEYDRKEKEPQKKLFSHPRQKTFTQEGSMQYAFRKMEGAFKSEYESWKNQRHYEGLQRDIERNHEQGLLNEQTRIWNAYLVEVGKNTIKTLDK